MIDFLNWAFRFSTPGWVTAVAFAMIFLVIYITACTVLLAFFYFPIITFSITVIGVSYGMWRAYKLYKNEQS